MNYAYRGLYGASGAGDISRAEDIVQEASIIALRNSAKFCGTPNPVGWLITTIRYVVKNSVNADGILEKHLQRLHYQSETISHDNYSIYLLFDGLVDPEEFDILKKIYLDGYKYQEMEQMLGLSPSAFAMRLKRIKSKFIKNYNNMCEKSTSTTHNKIGGFQRAKS